MEPRDLNRMFDALAPTPEQEQAGMDRLLQKERKVRPMKKLKKLTVVAIAAALMVISCAAAMVTGLDQRLLNYFGSSQEQAELLAPGAVPVDVTVEDNGATLHVTQVLMDRYSILILADFTAPEGTVLDMGEGVKGRDWGFGGMDWSLPELLDQTGKEFDLEQSWSWTIEALDDGAPSDNHLTMLMRMDLSDGIHPDWNVSALALTALDLVRFDHELKRHVTEYSGDWSCQFPISWQDMGQSIQLNLVAGQVDDVDISVTEIYLSPLTLQIELERAVPVPLHSDESKPGLYTHWLSAINSDRMTLTTKGGQTIPLVGLGSTGGNQHQKQSFQLAEITALEDLEGGTLNIRIEGGSVDIPLDNLVPAE